MSQQDRGPGAENILHPFVHLCKSSYNLLSIYYVPGTVTSNSEARAITSPNT